MTGTLDSRLANATQIDGSFKINNQGGESS